MDRRRFLTDLSVLTAASFMMPPEFVAGTSGGRLQTLGIQDSSLHADLNKDFIGTLARVAALGYREIEPVWWFGNFDRTPRQLRAALDAAGLSAPSGHVSAGALWVGLERRLEHAHTLGHEYLFCTDFGADTQTSLDDWLEWADRFNRAGEAARKAGIWMGLHNEDTGFRQIDEQIPYDVFLTHTDPAVTRHQLDIGNLALAGRDPVEYVKRFGNRYWSYHLKDNPETPNGSNVPGDGKTNFKALLALIPDLERKHFVVEFDATDAFSAAAKSYQYLRSLTF